MHREDQVVPELIVRNGTSALDFYKSVFGAGEIDQMTQPETGKLIHGELSLDGHKFFVCTSFQRAKGLANRPKHSEELGYASRFRLTTQTILSGAPSPQART